MQSDCTSRCSLLLISWTYLAHTSGTGCYRVIGRLVRIFYGRTNRNPPKFSGHAFDGAYAKPSAKGSYPTNPHTTQCDWIHHSAGGFQSLGLCGTRRTAHLRLSAGNGPTMKPYTYSPHPGYLASSISLGHQPRSRLTAIP
jgi:hypothetical protein